MQYTAIILAAGFGQRIAGLTSEPKSLLLVEGKSLLQRHFESWKKLGIQKVNLVLGYEREMVEKAASEFQDFFTMTYLTNEDYRTMGNTYSLYLGIKNAQGPILIFDADLVYDTELLERFIKDESMKDQILIGEGSLEDIECAKALVDKTGRVVKTVDKRAVTLEELSEFSFAGEAIGILKFCDSTRQRLVKAAEEFLEIKEQRNLNWEHLMNQFLPQEKVGVHKALGDHRWIEIDTEVDYQKACELFR